MRSIEKALRKYCVSEIVREYDESMSETAKQKLLDALLAAARQHLQIFLERQEMEINGLPRPLKDDKCPLIRALIESGFRCSAITEEAAEHTRWRLQAYPPWGSGARMDPMEKIKQYEALVARQKARSSYYEQGPTLTNTVAVKTGSSSGQALKKIPFSALKLFEVSRGTYVEGTIVGEVVQPMVGGTTLIQADRDILLVCFYNLLPDGVCGATAEPFLQAKLPVGATLRVKEPFLKIFGDGQRGIRVDNPRDLVVINKITVDSSQDAERLLQEKKKLGNSLVAKKRFNAATEMYLDGLRMNDIVPILLSNRAQAYIKLQQWDMGLCDAAASLTLRPHSAKTRARYDLCYQNIIDGLDSDERTPSVVFTSLASKIAVSTVTSETVQLSEAERLKETGNKAFKDSSYEEAIKFYTEAISASGETVRAVLGNWALCALNVGILGDVVAASVAAMRIGAGEKATHRLVTALSRLGAHDAAKAIISSLRAKPYENLFGLEVGVTRSNMYCEWIRRGKTENMGELAQFLADAPSLIGNAVGHMETFCTTDKGRGLRATRDLPCGSFVLVEWAPVQAKSDFSGGRCDYLHSTNEQGTIDSNSGAKIKWHTLHRLARDAVLDHVLRQLAESAVDKKKDLVPLTDLVFSLDILPVMLPCHREYIRGSGKNVLELSKEKIDGILATNIHGIGFNEIGNDNCLSHLWPGVAMMNHSSDPNCAFFPTPLEHLAIVVTSRDVQVGDELFMLYHHDDSITKTKWGISS